MDIHVSIPVTGILYLQDFVSICFIQFYLYKARHKWAKLMAIFGGIIPQFLLLSSRYACITVFEQSKF